MFQPRHRIVAYLLPLAMAAFLAGCSAATPRHSATAPSAQRTPLAAPTATTSPTATNSASPAASSSAGPGGASGCPSMSAALGSSQGAAGHILDVFTLTNTAAAACTLDGYPTLAMFAASGGGLPARYSHGADMAFPALSPRPVSLAAGATASFSVGYSDVPTSSASCPTAASVGITPPGGSIVLTVRTSVTFCGQIDVSPVVAGSNGAS